MKELWRQGSPLQAQQLELYTCLQQKQMTNALAI